ncbi:hypothetical protein SB766_26575, partial [Pseudomonas sp. SIMBA_077]
VQAPLRRPGMSGTFAVERCVGLSVMRVSIVGPTWSRDRRIAFEPDGVEIIAESGAAAATSDEALSAAVPQRANSSVSSAA